MPSTTTSPGEPQVAAWLKLGLVQGGLLGRPVRDILVDADGSYVNSPFARQLRPTGTVWIDWRRPDLVCVLEDGPVERLAAFEVKGPGEHDKGLQQARHYRRGAHEAYLCVPELPARSLGSLRSAATELGIGLVSATAGVLRIEDPPPSLVPDPRLVLATRRSLMGHSAVRALGLNKPLHMQRRWSPAHRVLTRFNCWCLRGVWIIPRLTWRSAARLHSIRWWGPPCHSAAGGLPISFVRAASRSQNLAASHGIGSPPQSRGSPPPCAR